MWCLRSPWDRDFSKRRRKSTISHRFRKGVNKMKTKNFPLDLREIRRKFQLSVRGGGVVGWGEMESKEMWTAPMKHFLWSLEKKRKKDWNRILGVRSLLYSQAEGEKLLEREKLKFRREGWLTISEETRSKGNKRIKKKKKQNPVVNRKGHSLLYEHGTKGAIWIWISL